MEKKLTALFDYQKFECSRVLEDVIDEVHTRYRKIELSLDDLQFVSAAGVPGYTPDREKRKK